MRAVVGSLCGVVMMLCACAQGEGEAGDCAGGACEPASGGGVMGGGGGSGTGGAYSPPAPAPICQEGAVRSCVCTDSRVGKYTCTDGKFGACTDCEATDAALGDLCKPGRYVGELELSQYYPNAAGICGLITLFGATNIKAAMDFSLGEPADANLEFLELVRAESCLEIVVLEQDETIDGMGDNGGESNRVEMEPVTVELTGGLDCATGVLQGELRAAYYSVSFCNGGMVEDWYSIKGTFSAVYDPEVKGFVDGYIDFQEPAGFYVPGLWPAPGGNGTWSAALDPDAPIPEPSDDCLAGAEWMDFELIER